jgi:enoyl-CoA hydratase/carnithine racemase
MPESVLVEREGAIATVVLNRPDKMNAMTVDMWLRLGDAFRRLNADDAVRCIVLRGAGTRAFAAGADIAEFGKTRSDAKAAKAYGRQVAGTMHEITRARHPTVALIHGACVGGGLELAAHCDLRIAGASARFGVPIKKLGLVVAYDEMAGLMALAGRAATLEILLEGRVFGADEAFAKGLLNRVVPDERVEEETYACARRIAEGAPLVARWHKKFALRLADPRPLTEEEYDESYACFETEDFKEGAAAFLAKRAPQFKGR